MAVPAVQHNTPIAGSISWSGFTIQIFGISYTVAAGSTNQRWVWWKFNGGVPTIEAGADLPSNLTDDDLVLFANRAGIAFRVQSANFLDGELIVDGTILADAIGAHEIATDHITTLGLDAGVILFGLMSGDRISVNTLLGDRLIANSIAASKLSIASLDNLIEDPGFINPIKTIATGGFWQGSTAATIVPAVGRNGANGLRFVGDGTTKVVFSPTYPTAAKKYFRGGYWIHSSVALAAGAFIMQIRSKRVDGTTGLNSNVAIPAIAANTWTLVTGMPKTADLDADAVTFDIRFSLLSSAPVGAVVTLDAYPSLTRANAGELVVDGTILGTHIKAGDITATQIAADTLTANEIAAGAITATEIATNAITAIKMSADSVLANAIKAGEIVTAHMLANTINGDRILANTLNANKIVAGSITTDRMTADSINGDRISAGTLDAAKIVAASITGDRITGTFLITGKQIKGGTILGNSIQTGQTKDSGARMEINEDIGGGFIKGFTNPAGGVDTAPTLINPRILNSGTARRQSLYLSSGAFGGGVASVDLVSGSVDGATNPRVVVDANGIFNQLVEISGNCKVMSTNDFIIDRYVGGGSTTASINNSGAIIRTGSSRDLKQNIELLTLEESRKVLDMDAVSFQWKPEQDMGDARQAGFIAEQTEEVGAELWVTRDEEGKASGVRYAEVTAAHNVIIKDQQERIEKLERKVQLLLDVLDAN